MQLERTPLDEDWRYLDVFVSSSLDACLSMNPPAGLTLHSGIMPCTGAACLQDMFYAQAQLRDAALSVLGARTKEVDLDGDGVADDEVGVVSTRHGDVVLAHMRRLGAAEQQVKSLKAAFADGCLSSAERAQLEQICPPDVAEDWQQVLQVSPSR
eukprot:COSAG01_NODE_463_length_16671_cov_192.938209_10_plen_155_part_00